METVCWPGAALGLRAFDVGAVVAASAIVP
jgi:hypothetical protein